MTKSVSHEYFLRTARLGFRCWIPDDVSLARQLWGDADVTRFFGGPFSNKAIGERMQHGLLEFFRHSQGNEGRCH